MAYAEQREFETLDEEFQLYMNHAKHLVLKMRNVDDRRLASAWLIKLQATIDPECASLRNDYMKILFYCMSHRKLLDPFRSFPDMDLPLEELPQGTKINELLGIITGTDTSADKVEGEEEVKLPYKIEVSSDKKQFLAVQEIPNFGIHCYFAVSPENLLSWENITNNIYETSHKDTGTALSIVRPPLHKHRFKYSDLKKKDSCGLEGVEVHRVVVDVFENQPQVHTVQKPSPATRKQPARTRIPMTQSFHATWRQMHLR